MWKPEEKLAVFDYVNSHKGCVNWYECARIVGTRSDRQCYDFYSLQKGKSEGQELRHIWTDEEVQKLMSFG